MHIESDTLGLWRKQRLWHVGYWGKVYAETNHSLSKVKSFCRYKPLKSEKFVQIQNHSLSRSDLLAASSHSTPPTFLWALPNLVTFSINRKCDTYCCDTLPLSNFHRNAVSKAELNECINEKPPFSPQNFPFRFAPFSMNSSPYPFHAHVKFMFICKDQRERVP